jgi:hypothetical protein
MTVHLGLNKILAALVQVVLFVLGLNHTYTKWGRLGRDAYLNYEAGRFDRYMGPDHSHLSPVIGALVIVTLAVASYEWLSAAFAKILPAGKP